MIVVDYVNLCSLIKKAIEKKPDDIEPYRDLFSACREWENVDFDAAHEENRALRPLLDVTMKRAAYKEDFNTAEMFRDQLFKSMLFGAPHFFDDYLQAVEFNRPYAKKFYLPRRHYLLRYVEAYQEILDGKLDFLSISMVKRGGKAVTLDTPIPTPYGFKTMGEIQVGDIVIGKDGKPTKVTDVFPQGKVPVYEVKFTDGAVVKTCGNHLWKVKYHKVNTSSRRYPYFEKIMTTKEMLDIGVKHGNGKSRHNIFAVEYCEPIEFTPQKVDIDPYVLGVLIGDGALTENCISITKFDNEIMQTVSERLPEGDIIYCQNTERGRWVIKSAKRKYNEKGYLLPTETRKILDKYDLFGKKSCEKHVPEEYLFNSAEVRFEILAGLLDTDGSADTKTVEYSTSSPYLRDDVMFLVRSLGGKCNCSERMGRYVKDGARIETRVAYRICIQFPCGVNPFKLKRKASRYMPKREKLYHYIENITPCGEEEAQCIRVDNKDHLFLVGNYFIPTHNSQLGLNFVNMISGLYPDKSTLMEGSGDALVNSFYQGCLEYVRQPSEYNFYDIFPDSKLVQTNADTKIFNLVSPKRFPTVMCRSIDSTQVGLSEATNLLYLDDCVQGREEAKNRQRLDDKWEVISGDILGRAIEGTPIVICGTRYSLYDPIGRLQEAMREQNKRMKIIETPALDPITDESNFEYIRDGKKVFTTQYFRDQRDMLSAEQFESEFQQQPFEAKGLLFPEKDLNYYYSLPIDKDPDAVIAVCDTAEKGSDFCSMPIAAIYGDEIYIIDVVFDDSPPTITKPQCAKAIQDNKVSSCMFESNNAGEYFARDVDDILKASGYSCAIKRKRTISNKQTRIEFASTNIIKHFWFKDKSLCERNSQYAFFMKQVTTYTRSGKVAHDDAPDSLSLLENEIRGLVNQKIEIFARPF